MVWLEIGILALVALVFYIKGVKVVTGLCLFLICVLFAAILQGSDEVTAQRKAFPEQYRSATSGLSAK